MFQKIIDWIDGCFSSSNTSSQDEDDEENSKSLSVAKGRLTKSIKRLSKTFVLVDQVRIAISDNQNFTEGVRHINSITSFNHSILCSESITLSKLNRAVLAIEMSCASLDHSEESQHVSIYKPNSSCPLLEPQKGKEPDFNIIESNFRKDLFETTDYEKALRKTNKANRALENKLNQIARTLAKLETTTLSEQENSSLTDYIIPCLIFYTTPFFTASGNLKNELTK